MRAPCGHSQAQCVVGNYWQCAVCDSAPAAITLPVAGGDAVNREVHRSKTTQLTQAELTACAEAVLDELRNLIAPDVRKTDNATGAMTCYLGFDGNKHISHLSANYVAVVLPDWVGPEAVYANVKAAAHMLVDAVNHDIDVLVRHHGWEGRYMVSHLGGLPHLVVDEGMSVLRQDPEVGDGRKLRLRAFWTVLPDHGDKS